MYYYSTRDKERAVKLSASQAILKGLAADGGLFVPSVLPALSDKVSLSLSYADFAAEVLKPFFEGDELYDELTDICRGAFSFPVVLNELKDVSVLELFHGPTSAFKDFGARFLAFSMEKLLVRKGEKLCILLIQGGEQLSDSLAHLEVGGVFNRQIILLGFFLALHQFFCLVLFFAVCPYKHFCFI